MKDVREKGSIKEGYLTKMGEKVRNWKKRFFALHPGLFYTILFTCLLLSYSRTSLLSAGVLYYFASEKSSAKAKVISVEIWRVV